MDAPRPNDDLRQPAKRPITWAFVLWLVAMTVLAAGLRLYKLDQASFWHDELMTIRDVIYPKRQLRMRRFGYFPTKIGFRLAGINYSDLDMADREARSIQPQTWRADGITEYSARLGSCLIGIMTVPLLGFACRRIMSLRAAGIFALLLAVGNWHIYWSQAARFYSFQFLFTSLTLIWYFNASRKSSMRSLIGAIILFIHAFLSHPLAVLIGGVLVADWLVAFLRGEKLQLPRGGRWIALAAVVSGPIFLLVVWIFIPAAFNWFTEVYAHSPAKVFAGTAYMVGPVVVAFGVLSAILLYRSDPSRASYFTLAAIMPTAGLILLAAIGFYAHVRYGFSCYFGWIVLAALGADRLYDLIRHRAGPVLAWTPLLVVVAASMFTNLNYFMSGGGYHPRWREAYQFVNDHYTDGDAVMSFNDEAYVDRYYLGRDLEVIDLKKRPKTLETLDRRGWIIARTGTATHGNQYDWLDRQAIRERSYELKVIQPYARVDVFRFEPGMQPGNPSQPASR